MQKGAKLYLLLFFYTLKLSAFTFGGGFVIVSLMRKAFVDRLHWISEEEMLDFAAISQTAPGAMAVNASILVGFRLAGFTGALLAIAATILPPLIIIILVSYGYDAFAGNIAVQSILRGMQAGVAAVLMDVTVSLVLPFLQEKRALPIILMTLSFAAVTFFACNVVYVILVCALLGMGLTLWRTRRKDGKAV